MRRHAMLSVLFTAAAFAAPPQKAAVPEPARAHYADALALSRAELVAEAVASLGLAIGAAPTWNAPYALRAKLTSWDVLTPATELAGRTFDLRFDYPSAIAKTEALLSDVKSALDGDLPRELAEQLSSIGGEARARLGALKAQHTQGRAAHERLIAQAAAEKKAAEQAAIELRNQRVKAQELAALQSAYEADLESAGGKRTASVVLGLAGVGAGVGAFFAAQGSAGAIDDIKEGRLSSGALVPAKAEEAGRLRTMTLVFGAGSAALLGTATLLWLSAGVTKPSGLSLSTDGSGAAVGFSGTF